MPQTHVPDAPRRPADAYMYVTNILPPGYLVANTPPLQGRKLMVKAYTDNVATFWEMDKDTARFIFNKLRDTGAPVDVTSSDYDNRPNR